MVDLLVDESIEIGVGDVLIGTEAYFITVGSGSYVLKVLHDFPSAFNILYQDLKSLHSKSLKKQFENLNHEDNNKLKSMYRPLFLEYIGHN